VEGLLVESRTVRPRTPQAILDAGGESWETIREVILRRMEELERGDILEIVSREPSTYHGITEWCWLVGHELIDVKVNGSETRLWIKKW
jgi:TusA-related sulfurtransferase